MQARSTPPRGGGKAGVGGGGGGLCEHLYAHICVLRV